MAAPRPNERKATASGLFNATYALTVSDTPAVTSSIAGDDELAEARGHPRRPAVEIRRRRRARAARPGRRREPTTPERHGPTPISATVERDLLVLAADFAQSDKLTASIRFADGQWLNFTEPITPVGPILSFDSLPLYSLIAGLVVIMSIWSLRRLTAPYRMMETAVNRIGKRSEEPADRRDAAAARSAPRPGPSTPCRPGCANMSRIANIWPPHWRMICARR